MSAPGTTENGTLTTTESLLLSPPAIASASNSNASFTLSHLRFPSIPNSIGTDGKRRWLRVKDALELDAEAIAGGDKSRDSVVVNVPFSVVPGADMSVARSSKYNY